MMKKSVKQKDVLFNKNVITHNMNIIQSKLHGVGTYDVYKISLSCFDDKRYVLDDGINTLAYFHKDIRDCKNDKEFMRMIKNSGE